MRPFRRRNRKTKPDEQSEQKISRRPLVGRLLLFIFALLLCAVPVFFVNNIIGYLPLIALILAIIFSYVYMQILVHSLSFSEDSLMSTCRRGTDIDFVVKFQNRSPLVFLRIDGYFYISDLFGGISTSIPASLVLMPFEKRDFEFTGKFNHIGEYTAGIDRVVVYDLFGFFSRTIKNENRHAVSVLPKVFDIEALDLSNISVQENSRQFQPIVTDDMDYAGVRTYVWGDPLKTIHWNLSARLTNGDLLTRLYETQGNPGVSVIVDSTSPEYDAESLMQIYDSVVESAVSTCIYSYERGIDAGLVYLDRAGERRSTTVVNVGDSMELIEDLPRISVESGADSCDCLRSLGLGIHAQANVVFCTAHVNEEIISTLLEIKMRQKNPLLFVAVPQALADDERRTFLAPLQRLSEAGIVYYVIDSAEDLCEGAV